MSRCLSKTIINKILLIIGGRLIGRYLPGSGSEWVGGWVSKWVGGWVSEWVGGWMSEWVGGWVNEWVGWVGERMGG